MTLLNLLALAPLAAGVAAAVVGLALVLSRPWRRSPRVGRAAPPQRPTMYGLWWALTEPDRQLAEQRWPWDTTDDLPAEWRPR